MTTYDKDYANTSGAAKRFKAMADIIDYLGDDRFNKVHAEMLAWTKANRKVPPAMIFAVAGIQMYPVRAWQEMLCIELGFSYTVNEGNCSITVVPPNTGNVVPLKKGHADE